MGIVSEIHTWNRGRELQRLRLKYAKMETDAFSFFRGTAHLFFRDWPLFSSRSAVPGASGSPVNARTILRRLMTSVNSMPEA